MMQITHPCRRGALVLAVGLLTLVTPRLAHAADPICATAAETIKKAPTATRMSVIRKWLAADCETVPAFLWTAVETGKWAGGAIIIAPDRAALLQGLTENGHPQAVEMVSATLGLGAWPNGDALQPTLGATLIESLHGSHDRRSVLLLLDVYDQIKSVRVRESVIRSLAECEIPEARLPALDAFWKSDATLKELAEIALASWSKDSAEDQLKWTMGELKEGPALAWAKRIQNRAR